MNFKSNIKRKKNQQSERLRSQPITKQDLFILGEFRFFYQNRADHDWQLKTTVFTENRSGGHSTQMEEITEANLSKYALVDFLLKGEIKTMKNDNGAREGYQNLSPIQ